MNKAKPQNTLSLVGSLLNTNLQHQPIPYYAHPMSSGLGPYPMNPMPIGGYLPQTNMMPQVPYEAPQIGMGINMGMNVNMGYNPMGGYQNSYNPYNNYGMYGYRPY